MIKKISNIALIILTLVSSAEATVILGSYNRAGSGGGSGTESTFYFGLGYDFSATEINSAGFTDGTTGSFDFNSSNTPAFSNFVQTLTNSTDNMIWNTVKFLQKGYTVGDGNYESYAYPPFSSLQLWNPEFIRLVINNLSIKNTLNGTTSGSAPYFDYSYNINWEVWGTATLPEPTTILLLGLGLIGIVGVRRKFNS